MQATSVALQTVNPFCLDRLHWSGRWIISRNESMPDNVALSVSLFRQWPSSPHLRTESQITRMNCLFHAFWITFTWFFFLFSRCLPKNSRQVGQNAQRQVAVSPLNKQLKQMGGLDNKPQKPTMWIIIVFLACQPPSKMVIFRRSYPPLCWLQPLPLGTWPSLQP